MIEIQVVSRAGRPWRDPRPVRFEQSGGDIGRGADCRLVLEDTERRISRKQAAIVYREGAYRLHALSAGASVELDGQALGASESRALAVGDEITIGPYLLRVHALADESAVPRSGASIDQRVDPLDLFESVSDATPANPLRALLKPAAQPAGKPAAAPRGAAPAPRATARDLDVNVGDPTSIERRPVPPRAAPPDPALAAFLAGVGVPNLVLDDDAAVHLEAIGRLFREALQGTLDLLAARSSVKRALHADATMLRSRENNPLKFSPTVETALAHLLTPTGRGFMQPEPAMRDAFDDLRAHQLAVMAGMRAALAGVLGRFDPARLEERLTRRSTWETLVPAARKAKLWDLFNEHYAEIRTEASEDFDTLFGRAFLEAYAGQLAALRERDG